MAQPTFSPERVLAATARKADREIRLTLVIDGRLREFAVSRATAAAIGKAIFDALKA